MIDNMLICLATLLGIVVISMVIATVITFYDAHKRSKRVRVIRKTQLN